MVLLSERDHQRRFYSCRSQEDSYLETEGQSPCTNISQHSTHPEREKWKKNVRLAHVWIFDNGELYCQILYKNYIAKSFILRTIFHFCLYKYNTWDEKNNNNAIPGKWRCTHYGFIASFDLSSEDFIHMMFAIHMSCPFADQCKCCLPLIRDASLQKTFD